MKVSGILKSIWPESQVDGSWPLLVHVQQRLPSTFTKITNGLLGNPILEVSINATEGEVLPCTLTRLFEGVVGKSPIAAAVMKDLDTVLFGKDLESLLGLYCLL